MNRPTKEVNIAKNLTDAFAFIAAIFAFAAVLIAKKNFEPDEEEALLHFLDVPETKEALKIGVVFLFSGLFCVLTRAFPTLGCPVSFVPFIVTIEAFKLDLLAFDKHPNVYIILGAVHFIGSLIYLCQWFTEKPRQSFKNSMISAISGIICAAAAAAMLVYDEVRGFTGFSVYVEPVWKTLIVFSTLSGLIGVLWFLLSDKRRLSAIWWSSAASVAAPLLVVVKIFFIK